MEPYLPWIIGGGIILLLILWVVSAQRKLVHFDENINNALSQIGVQLTSRWDALTALLDLTKGYAAHESEALLGVTKMRRTITMKSSPAEVNAQENIITEAMGKIMAVAEAYPDLKANQNYIKTMDSVNQYENQVRTSRMVYNDSVTKLNRLIRTIPTCFIAGMLGFSQRAYLEDDVAKADMPSMK